MRLANEVIVDENLVDIFPNPASEFANLQIEANQEVNVRITNLTGQIVYNVNNVMVDGVYSTTINTSDFATGMYMLTVEGNNMLISKQFVVNK